MSEKLKINMISESTFTVQGHGVHTAFEEMTSALRARHDMDVVVNKFRRRADITHIQTFGLYSLAHLLFGAGKKVVSVHVVPDSLVGSIAGAKYFYGLVSWYLRLFYGRADLLLAVSPMVEKCLRSQLRIKKPIKVLYNTVDMGIYKTDASTKAAARQALGLAPDAHVAVSCAQIQPRKRFDLFCDVAKQLPDTRFVWVGGIPFKHFGADYKHMRQLVSQRPPNVVVTGVINHKNVRAYLQAADIFFLPSEQENHPMAVLEAAGAGLPIVLRDIPEYATFEDDIVRGKDATFVTLIKQLKADSTFRAEAVEGAARIAKRFDSRAGGERLVELYKEVLG